MSPQSPRLDVLITPDLLMFLLVEYWSTGDSWLTRLKARPPQKKKKQVSNFQGRDSASQADKGMAESPGDGSGYISRKEQRA
jgi:hypothetical protein